MAGMSFGNLFGQGTQFNAAGPQFDLDTSLLKHVSYTTTGINDETAYTVPAGKTFLISKFVIMNLTAADTHEIKFGSTTVTYHTLTAGASQYVVDFPIPLPATSGTIIYVRNYNHLGNKYAFLGWET